jgi:hypothetical protein
MRIVHPSYREENQQTDYPFVDGSSLLGSQGFSLSKSTFFDAVLHPVGRNLPQRLSKISITDVTATITLSDDSGVSCTGSVSLADPNGVVGLTDASGRPAGLLLGDASQLSLLQSWTAGDHIFGLSAQFVASVTIPDPGDYVTGLLADGADALTGDIWIVGEQGVIVTEEDGAIRVDIVGDPLFKRSLCDETTQFVTSNYLKTINDIPPDAYGRLNLIPSQTLTQRPALRIYPSDSGELVIALASPGT